MKVYSSVYYNAMYNVEEMCIFIHSQKDHLFIEKYSQKDTGLSVYQLFLTHLYISEQWNKNVFGVALSLFRAQGTWESRDTD